MSANFTSFAMDKYRELFYQLNIGTVEEVCAECIANILMSSSWKNLEAMQDSYAPISMGVCMAAEACSGCHVDMINVSKLVVLRIPILEISPIRDCRQAIFTEIH